MKTGSRIVRIGARACLVWGLCAVATPAFAWPAVMELEVVEINGVAVEPATEVTVNRGDQFKIEVYLRDWAPDAVQTYQFRIDGGSLTGGSGGSLVLAEIPCTSDSDCHGSAACDSDTGFCECLAAVYVVANPSERPDYLFYDLFQVYASDCTSGYAMEGYYGAGATLLNPVQAPSDTGVRKYVGTVILQVDDWACGDFTVVVLDDPDQTFVIDRTDHAVQLDLSATLTVHVSEPCVTTGACCDQAAFVCVDDVLESDCDGRWTLGVLCDDLVPSCEPHPTVLSADPPGCAIDARQPHELNDASVRYGWDTFTITFQAGSGADMLTPADFTVTQFPPGPPAPPTVVNVIPSVGESVHIEMSGPINEGTWMCLALAADGAQDFCWGYLPGDVDGSMESNPSDILAVIDCINRVPSIPCHPWQVDADRSGVLEPSDIIRVIDLLNGASSFQPWFGAALSPARCPD